MAIEHQDNPVFLTREDVSKLLRLTKRQIDNLSKAGKLHKTKLSASRSGFHRDDIADYLQRNAPAKPPPQSSPSQSTDFTLYSEGYGSRGVVLIVDVECDGVLVGEALDDWLPKQGIRGCFITATSN